MSLDVHAGDREGYAVTRRQISWRPPIPREFLRSAIPLILLMLALSWYTDARDSAFLSWTSFQNILTQTAVLGILTVGQTFLIVGGQLDLSVGSMVSFLSVVGAYLFVHHVNSAVIALLLIAVGGIVGTTWGLIVSYLRVPAFILTLGGLSAFSSLALVIAHNRPISVVGAFDSLGFGSWLGLPAPGALFLGVTLVGALILHITRFGRHIYALGSSEESARLAGLPTHRIKVEMFALNGLLVGLAALVQLARLAAGDPASGNGLELSAIAAIVLGGATLTGGRGTMAGSLLGALTFGVIDASLVFLNIGGAWQDFVTGAVLILAVTATAVADARRERRSGRQASWLRSLRVLTLQLVKGRPL